jgi:membrane protein
MKPRAANPLHPWRLVRTAARTYLAGDTFTLGAALAYYTVFSVAPLLIIVIAVAGIAFGRDAVQGEIVGQIEGLIGTDGARAIEAMVRGAARTRESVWAALGSAVLLLVGATSVFGQLRKSLDVIWDVKPRSRAAMKLLIDRVFSFAMVVCLGFLMLVSLVIHAGVVGLSQRFESGWAGKLLFVIQAAEFVASLALTTLLFAVVYKFMSDARVRWRDVWAGAAFTAVLFDAGKFAIGTYLGHARIADTYGVAGSVVVLLLWVFYSSQILFFGAEFIEAYAEARGSRIEPGPYAVRDVRVEVVSPPETPQPVHGSEPS